MSCNVVPFLLFAVGTAAGGGLLLRRWVRYGVAALGLVVWLFVAVWPLIGDGDGLRPAYQACGFLEVLLYPVLGATLGAVLVMIVQDIARPHPE